MSYFGGLDMKRVEPALKAGETDIVAVFCNKSIFRGNEDWLFCWLGDNGQVLKLNSVGRGMMVYEFVCTCHGNMVDHDTGKPCLVILNYSKNYNGYWKREDATIQRFKTLLKYLLRSTLVVFHCTGSTNQKTTTIYP